MNCEMLLDVCAFNAMQFNSNVRCQIGKGRSACFSIAK